MHLRKNRSSKCWLQGQRIIFSFDKFLFLLNKGLKIKKNTVQPNFFAERKGFEPSIRFWRIHAFQACAFDHSATSLKLNLSFRNNKKITSPKNLNPTKSFYFEYFQCILRSFFCNCSDGQSIYCSYSSCNLLYIRTFVPFSSIRSRS